MTTPPKHLIFDPTAEIFATENTGRFLHELRVDGAAMLDTKAFDEVRFVLSLWHPAGRSIDLDSAYVELVCSWSQAGDRWIKLAEIEPVVPPYGAGETFDGWIVLPIISANTAYALAGSGFEPRARLQIRASAYLVA
ncbi:MAG: hypothetical protein OEM62_03410 [Acidobacteriota bacterium]|nr:hypothetical protein [Acidobacteriota bacterium]